MAMNIADWQEIVYNNAVDKGWHEEPACEVKAGPLMEPVGVNHDRVAALIALIHSEASEALEEVRAGKFKMYTVVDDRGFSKPEGLESELADIIIRCLDLGGDLGLNIEAAMQAKYKYNMTRESRHGGKHL